MKILSIETSCDETAISLVEVAGDFPTATYEIAGNALHSQIDTHTVYGGVFPTMAKREHIKRIMPLCAEALQEAGLLTESAETIPDEIQETLHIMLYREEGLADALITFAQSHTRPEFDLIAVTSGPGLEPALWVGINFAKALSYLLNVPIIPVNHMEGHILASVFDVVEDDQLAQIEFPAVSLLISGGHTELVLIKDWAQYEKIGQTRDDAVGEAFDKVARLMGLPYPGGPEISKLAAKARAQNLPPFKADLPAPMIHSGDLDFSFSGLKTAVRYAIEDIELTDTDKLALARDFEDVVAKVLIAKTAAAVDEHAVKTIIVGGGVSANRYLREQFNAHFLETHPDLTVYFPNPGLSTDNAIMIALVGHAKHDGALSPSGARDSIRAQGNKSL